MARLSTSSGDSPDVATINLTRLVDRLQQNLLKPDATTEHRLRTSIYERRKTATNIEYARTLLLRLEQDAAEITVLSRKQQVQMDFLRKRDAIEGLTRRLQQFEESAIDSDDDTSEGEDLLGEDTPSDDLDEPEPEPLISKFPTQFDASPVNAADSSTTTSTIIQQQVPPTSTLRSRTIQAPQNDTAKTTSSTTTTAPTILQEQMLSHNRAEQEALTDSILAMAQALKASAQGFSETLEADKEIVDRSVAGLDKNVSGLEAAQKRMGLLTRMSEGKGWWGRMMLYAWIFGLMFLAFFIVAFMPKLRF